MPFVWGTIQIALGLQQYKKEIAISSLRKDSFEMFESMRHFAMFEHASEILCLKSIKKIRDEKLEGIVLKKIQSLIENLSGNIMTEKEQELIYNIFEDYLAHSKKSLREFHTQKLDLLQVVGSIIKFIKHKFDVKTDDYENDEDLDPFVSDTLQALTTCLHRPVDESKDKFLVPLENLWAAMNEYNKNAVYDRRIPLRDLESLLTTWRQETHAWAKMDDKLSTHLGKGVDVCLQSLFPLLQKWGKKVEALAVPFMLFCHNAFLGDFHARLQRFDEILTCVSADEPEVGQYLRAILLYFRHFAAISQENLSQRKKELKMKFDVQIKTNKRLYETNNLANHFKAAYNIVRDTSRKLGELCLAQARTHFNWDEDHLPSLSIFHHFELSENYSSDEMLSKEIQIRKDLFFTTMKSSERRNEAFFRHFNARVDDWREDAKNLKQDVLENKSKKLTFHVMKTKASNMMASLKDFGLSKSIGNSFDLQVFRVLQCLKSSQISSTLLQSCFKLEKLSTLLLLPLTGQSKAFAFCRLGQDFLAHGNLLMVKICQRLNKNHLDALSCAQDLQDLQSLDEVTKMNCFDVFMAAKETLVLLEISLKTNHFAVYAKLRQILQDILQTCSLFKVSSDDLEKWRHELNPLSSCDKHGNVQKSLEKLILAVKRALLSFKTAPTEVNDEIRVKLEAVLKSEAKSRFLALQTVIKKVKASSDNQSPMETLNDAMTWLEILDIESFKIGLQALKCMAQGNPISLTPETSLIFKSYLNFWRLIFQSTLGLFQKSCLFMKSVAETLKFILDYKYSEGKENEDQDKETDDSGDAQGGCGLGNDDTDGAKATTSDVTSEDIFDSAERPNQDNEDDDDQEDKDTKEEDGFDVDNVEDNNPKELEEEDKGENGSDEEDNDEKEQEMDAEEGKADENIDEEAWENEEETKEEGEEQNETPHESKESSKQDKAGHENEQEKEEETQQDQSEKVPEDENKRQRKDENFEPENEEELDMNDETYGKNEPPEPEDLDLNADDDMIGDEGNDSDDGNDELPPEEEQRLADFEDEKENNDDEQADQDENLEVTKSTGGNAGQDEAKPEDMDEDQNDPVNDQDENLESKGDKVPNMEEKKDQNEETSEGIIAPDDNNDKEDIEEKGQDNEPNPEEQKDEKMMTDETDDLKHLPVNERVEETMEDNEKVDEKSQEFSHSKDKLNTANALDAMDIDNEEKPKFKQNENENELQQEEQQREGKTLDLSKLKDAITIDTENVQRNKDTVFGQSNAAFQDLEANKDYEMKSLDDISKNVDDLSSSSEDVKKWLQLTHETSELTQNLTEQLRLILEATRATRFKGDYKSGKRINMRKVIPFIASNYRKDKIWLRRTKASKRDYNVILAVDDSTSMRANNVDKIVDKSMAIVCQTLSSLEVGKLGVVKFGKEAQIVQNLQVISSNFIEFQLFFACLF